MTLSIDFLAPSGFLTPLNETFNYDKRNRQLDVGPIYVIQTSSSTFCRATWLELISQEDNPNNNETCSYPSRQSSRIWAASRRRRHRCRDFRQWSQPLDAAVSRALKEDSMNLWPCQPSLTTQLILFRRLKNKSSFCERSPQRIVFTSNLNSHHDFGNSFVVRKKRKSRMGCARM